MADDGLTIDQRGLRTSGTRLRTYLPDELVARYEPLHNLNVAAGQADLVVARIRASGEEVVVKLYRNAEQLDREVMERLYGADTAHVVRLLEHGETDGEPWEVQEYCALGTLTDYRLKQGGRLSEAHARAAVKELADAIHHIHGLNITHRDLKPENILVRSLNPLNLVLTDFGVAAEQIATVQLQTVAASWVWAAPEVHTKGAVSRDIDWWAMGAIVHQLLTGRHPLSGSDGRLPGDLKVIRAGVVDGLYSTETIAIERWRDLVDGLLSYEPTQRWGYEQVTAWLNGENPEVVRTSPLAEQLRAAKSAPPAETREHLLVWNGAAIRTGLELVLAMRAEWSKATEYLNRWPDKPLRDWLLTRPSGHVIVQVLDLEANGDGRLIRLQAKFDPAGPLEFMGRAVNDESLNQAIKVAERWTPDSKGEAGEAHVWLGAIRDQHILKSIAAAVESDSPRLIRADQLLNDWNQAAQAFIATANKRVGTEHSNQSADAAARRFRELRGLQFSAAMSGSIPKQFSDRAREMASSIGRTLDALANHELLPKASPWAKGQRTRDTLISLADQVTNASQENLGVHIPASIYLEMMGQICSHDLATLRAEAEGIKREREERERAEREARERAEREARERAEREARLAVERAEAEKKRLEEATQNARAGAKKWWDERLIIEQQNMQASEDERTAKATEALNQGIGNLTTERDRQKRSAGWSFAEIDDLAVPAWITGLGILGAIWAVPEWNVEAVFLWGLEYFPISAIALIGGFIVALGTVWWLLGHLLALFGWVGNARKRSTIERQYRQKRGSLESNLKPSRTVRVVRIPVDKVGAVIGKGGEIIRTITASGVTVDIQGWHEVAPPSWANSTSTYTRSAMREPPAIHITKEKWEGGKARERPWIRPKKAASGPFSLVYKSAYWEYVDKDFLSKDSRQQYNSYRRGAYSPTDDDQWYFNSEAYQDTRRFDDFGGLISSSRYGGSPTVSSHDHWDWFEEPAALPPAPTPPAKTVRGEERRKWKVAYKDAVEDYKRIRHEYERIFKGPAKGHGGIVVAVVTAESVAAADRAVAAIGAAMTAPRDAVPAETRRVPQTLQSIGTGQQFSGLVKNIVDFGAFVELVPGVDGLLHISEMKTLNNNRRVERVSDVLRVGQVVKVTVHQVKPGGKYSLKLAP